MVVPVPTAASTAVARLQSVRKHYGKLVALDGVDLQLQRGELLALLGPNGAGKTTAVSSLLGLVAPDGGQATLFDEDPRTLRARRRIGVMLQDAALGTLRVDELIRLTSSYYPAPRDFAGTASLAGVGDLLTRRYARLSGGQKRRVQFALAICGNPEVLFLDEPTTGLDIEARAAMWQALRALVDEGRAIVLTTHYLEEAEALADRVIVLNRGRIVAEGSVDAIRARVAQRRIRCITTLSPATLRSWPQVERVESDGDRLTVIATETEAVVRRLLAVDPALRELEVQRAGLAEAFVEITRHEADRLEAA